MSRFAIPIAVRTDFDPATLCRLAHRTNNSAQARRLLAVAVINDGGSREAPKRADQVMKFNAEGTEGLIDRKFRKGGRSTV